MFANIKFKYIYFYKLFSRIRMVRAMPAAAAGAVPPAGLSPPKTLLLVPTHTHTILIVLIRITAGDFYTK